MASTFGPVELIALGFPDDRIPDEVKAQLAALVVSEQVRIIDLVVVRRPLEGDLEIIELEDLGDELAITDVELEGGGLAGDEDIADIAEAVPAGTSALVLVFEHVWSNGIAQAIRETGGVLLAAERIPAEVVAAIAELEDASA
ncbi:DUF1269 domain-containing protein [Cellulomonas sp. JH27-2]|uniref:DUF6325 family protein n=1 Tax=Cellulomonas sp. JH27-2 TaxID=2774139 RepID=UPI0017811023|nr:DUF6325 family protein [Cellulomonas sp. JH27-2]MBD8059423.1 DUF1269 domain-containing protein [Cellulomonas sp. JH27-2]